MKTIVAIVVYNRLQNIKLWINCWKQCNHAGAELVIIHNYYGDLKELEKFKTLCDKEEIKYIPRNGTGFDIGAFQDVCKERLPGFDNNWHKLLWITDDTVPMNKDFVSMFFNKLDDLSAGVVCMEISSHVVTHVRTTGFAIRKNVSLKLEFPSDPMVTKNDCYLFEHSDKTGRFILYNQVTKRIHLRCEMVTPKEISPLWDMGYWRRLDRQSEHEVLFNKKERGDKVVFICPIYEMYPQIISSLICQTHKNWDLLLIHNGSCSKNLKDIIESYKDERINFIEYPEQTGKWGHPLRAWALNEIREERLYPDADYIVITNADNYHAPSYCEYMLKGFKVKHTAVATYCDAMVHNYKAWQVIPCSLRLGYIDCAGVMVKKEIACEIGWSDVDSHSSDFTYFSEIAKRYGPSNFIPIKGCLLVHN